MALRYFVGTHHAGQAKIARECLEAQEFEVYLPMYVAEYRRREPAIKPYLPPYFFVRMDTDDPSIRWRSVYSTRGVRSVISAGDKPMPIPDWVIAELLDREVDGLIKLPPRNVSAEEWYKVHSKFKNGDQIAVRSSPLEAVFNEPLDRRRAEIFINLFNRQHKIVVDLSKLAIPPAVVVV